VYRYWLSLTSSVAFHSLSQTFSCVSKATDALKSRVTSILLCPNSFGCYLGSFLWQEGYTPDRQLRPLVRGGKGEINVEQVERQQEIKKEISGETKLM